MDDVNSDVGAMIVRNIDVFQSAFEYAQTRMNDVLGKKVIEIFETQRQLINGDGDKPDELDDTISVASPAWRKLSDGGDRFDHYLWITFEGRGDESTLWLSEFAGASGGGILLRLSTVLSKRSFQAILKVNPRIQNGFRSLGMTIDSRSFYMPLELERERLAQGFADEDLTEALEPLADGLRRIIDATELTTALLEAVREVG